MTLPPTPPDKAVEAAEGRLAELGVQIDAMQALLVRLMQDVVREEKAGDDRKAGRLVEVNEKLVVAAMAAQADAEAAAQARKQAAQSSLLDALTHLPNRTALLDRFEQAVAAARRHGTRFALLFVDLDHFKQLNDAHGHVFGDKVLHLAAGRMLAAVREVDTVSRHGGDEFLVLLAELNQPADAQAVAEKLIRAVGAPATIDDQVVRVTASIGIAICPDDGEDFDTLVARADAAMYASKRRHAGSVTFHATAAVGASGKHAPPSSPAPQPVQAGTGAATAEGRLADLREANERLVLAVISAQELQAAAERARERQVSLITAVAEELKNPEAPIRIASTMLGRPPNDDPLLPRVKKVVERQMTQMSRLVGDLVEAANLDSGELKLDLCRVDLGEVIERSVAAIRPMIGERGQRFELRRPTGTLDVQGDAARLEQVVSNLLDNASKYTHEGGRISLSVDVTADKLTLTVADNGIGITSRMLPHVFEPFVQDAQALGFSGAGLGIGLTVARALVQAHGGTLAAASEGVNRGSRFMVTLPRTGSEQATPDAGSASNDSGST